jgi:hypothetical protein
MEKRQNGTPKGKQKNPKAKYNANTLTKAERDKRRSFRLKRMRGGRRKKRIGV